MREILFRGKRTDNGEWVEGYLLKADGVYTKIINYEVKNGEVYDYHYFVDPKTVGEYVGMTDKNGKRIFEGDIIMRFTCDKNTTLKGVVEYADGAFGVRFADGAGQFICFFEYGEVIGNIYDNPELLKESEDTE